MIRIAFSSIVLSLLIVLNTACTSTTNEQFEGKITYVNLFDCYHPNRTSEYYKKQYGDTVVIFYKNGNYKQVYNSKDSTGISTLTYDAISNYAYLKTNANDSLAKFYCTEDPNKKLLTSSVKKSNKRILGEDTYEINLESVFEGYSKLNIQNKYYFSKSLLGIDTSDLSTHTLSYLSELSEQGHFYTGYEYTDYETHKRFQKAIKIENIAIPDSIFEIDPLMVKTTN